MSSATLPLEGAARRGVSPWIIAAIVVVPTFMEILDTTIAVVALRYIAGGLSAAVIDSEWVITSYLAANATVLPISGFLAARLGRRNYFLLSIAVFTIASALCGMATNLSQLILFRVLQGLAGGGLQPCSQGILIDSFPREKQGSAMTLFGIAALFAPVIGPTLGGYIVDNYEWRWIFYLNVPVGAMALLSCYALLEDPAYLKQEQRELRRQRLNFDYMGLGLLALAMSCWEVFLSKGQQWDWWGDPFWRVQTLAAVFAVALLVFLVRETSCGNPVVNLRPLKERNFLLACLIIFSAYAVLYAFGTTLPTLLQTLFGYDAFHSGLVMSPSGLIAVCMMLVVGYLLGKKFDARWLIGAGLLVMACGAYWMSIMNLNIDPWQAAMPRMVFIGGLSMTFAPLNVAAYLYTPKHLRLAAVGLFNLLRNEGASVGTSLAQTLRERRGQFHLERLNDKLDALNPQVDMYCLGTDPAFSPLSDDGAHVDEMVWQAIAQVRFQQADSLAYFDVFFTCAVGGLVLILLVFFMKRSVAEESTSLAAE